MKRILKCLGLVLCCACIVLIGGFVYRLPDYLDPQGMDPRAPDDGTCFSTALPTISNGYGLVVSGHHTYCDNLIHDSAVYVYLRRDDGADDRRHLVFRYCDNPLVPEPKIQWTGKSALSISVGPVVLVSKAVPSMEGIEIVYSVKSEQYPRSYADRETLLKALLAGGVLAFGALMIVLSWRLIRSLRGGMRRGPT